MSDPLPAAVQYDILISGAGAVGASLACALAGSRYRIAVVEATAPATPGQAAPDGRGLALSLAAYRILSDIGVWRRLIDCANPIRRIHVSHRGHFGSVRLNAEQAGVPAVGFVVPALRLGAALLDGLADAGNIDLIRPAQVSGFEQHDNGVLVHLSEGSAVRSVGARLLVGADGSQSRVRELAGIGMRSKDYGQTAIVSSVRPQRPHADTAFERFTDSGPLALLPLRDGRCVAVCCVRHEQAGEILAQSDGNFIKTLEQRFGLRLGRLQDPGPRQAHPLKFIESQAQHSGRALLLGNSVHTLHPNAAQGFNLGLSDAAALARRLRRHGDDPGAANLIEGYLAERRPAQKRVVRFTDSLAWLFYRPHPLWGPARSFGMLALELVPSLKRAFIRRTAGLVDADRL